MPKRSCPFCGKPVETTASRCPFCREDMPQAVAFKTQHSAEGRKYMRRGFLYTLMAGVIYFFAGGYSGMTLPIPIPPAVNTFFTPILFIAGLGLILYGLVLYIRG